MIVVGSQTILRLRSHTYTIHPLYTPVPTGTVRYTVKAKSHTQDKKRRGATKSGAFIQRTSAERLIGPDAYL